MTVSAIHAQFGNTPRNYQHITVIPLTAAMGAEIRNVDASNITDAAFSEVEDALFRHKMIYLRDQTLDGAKLEAFSARFGDFAEDAYTDGVDGYRNVQPIIKEADEKTGWVFGSGWHTDSPFLARPPAISILYGVDIPPVGGDTVWANSALAYQFLSPAMRNLLSGLKVHMSIRDVFASAQMKGKPGSGPVGKLVALRGAANLPPDILRNIEGVFHPLVRTHPVTGEQCLYVDGSYAIGFEGFEEEEAAPLLKFLTAHITQQSFTCRLRWRPKTLALWDNRLCIHQAFNDYDGRRREMYRTTIAGEAPQ